MYPFMHEFPFMQMMLPVWYVLFFWMGATFGSFLNVCIWRIPRGESVIWKASHCPKCGHKIRFYENIPIFSWLALRGKCRMCKQSISPRYIMVEILAGLVLTAFWHKVLIDQMPITMMATYTGIMILLITTFFIDAEHRIIPNAITYPIILWGLISAIIFPMNFGIECTRLFALTNSFSGAVFGILFFLAFAILGKIIFKREAIGMGDVKYLGAVGACLGFKSCFMTVFIGSLLGSIGGILIIILGRGKLKSGIAFGPYLAAGTIIWELLGEKLIIILDWLIYSAKFNIR